jgi:dipeptidyl aminopeptidase/acylaminoacyl peptidase
MFDPRIVSLAPFEPHSLAVVQRALPAGAIDEAIYDNIKKRYARLETIAIKRLVYRVDGLNVTGVFAHPTSITPGAHPLLIFNRGGNGEYGMLVLGSILRYMGTFAEQGYLVLGSNYRGNDGGEGIEEFGGTDLHDVLQLIEIGKTHPGWDGRNIFMFGGSRGGTMTYIAIKQGPALNAAATFGAPSDMWAAATERPEMEKVFARRLPDYETNREEAYASRSAIKWPQALAHAPLLMMHGTADTAVLVSHTERLSEALTGVHPDFKTVIYEGGNHPLSTHMKQMLGETLDWFRAHRT